MGVRAGAVRRASLLASGLLAALAAGCASHTGGDGSLIARLTPYRIEIVQGNVITAEQAARVKPGQTRAQVRDILGTPLVADPFFAQRWDYIFTIRRDGVAPQRRSVVVWFKDDRLDSIEAPDLPSEVEFVQGIARERRKGEPPVLELTEAQRAALPRPTAATAAAPAASAPAGPARSYPPLGDG